MSEESYRVCVRCVMDTSDPQISFDASGVCSHCREFDLVTRRQWFPGEEGRRMLETILERVRREGRGRDYDCIIGLSGGVDSSYLALVLKDYDLRPLVVHVDAGWNSEIAVYNIEQIVKHCGYELYTHVMDWQEIRDLQVAYLRAGVANQDVIQDHAFFAMLYHFAVRNGIRHIMSGGNFATEAVFPRVWQHAAMDALNLRAIHHAYGSRPLKQFRTISFFQYYFYYPFVKKMNTLRPLNYLPYDKRQALRVLQETVGYKEYGRKHGESRFTKFFQNYYAPVKFNTDIRRPHLSSLVLSGQLTREEALRELQEPLYDPAELEEDRRYVAKKLGLSEEELEALVRAPGRSYREFRNWDSRHRVLKKTQGLVEKALGRKMNRYS